MSNPPNFNGLHVASFESRRADDMARLIERHGGVAHVAPSMREVPLDDNPEAVDFAHRLMTGRVDIVIFMTGVGFKHLLAAVERKVDRERFLASLSDCITVARGPKPVAAMREAGITPTHRVGEPNTWRDVLDLLDAHVPIASQTVALQEYGITNPSLIAGLEARGAKVDSIKVYNWELPEDTGPLEETLRLLAAGEMDVVMFTSANQVATVLKMAEQLDLAAAGRRSIAQIASSSALAPRRAKSCGRKGCRSIWSLSIPRWGKWSSPRPSGRASCSTANGT